MKRSAILFVVLSVMLAFGSERGFAQHARGPAGGPSAGHGAPPTFSRPAEATPGTSSSGRTGTARADKQGARTGTTTAGASHPASFSDRLAQNTALSSRLQSLLPAGTNLRVAAAGFKSQGQFIAAIHVSHNLNIPFDQLKAKLTGAGHESFGKAIRDLRPDLSARQARADVHTAQRQAQRDLTAGRLADQLAGNSKLRARLQSMLPAGTNLQAAAAGFKNEGQFIATVHVSRNLKIPFDQLKAKLVGPNPESLGQAIHDLKPDLSARTIKTDVKTAKRQTKDDTKDTKKNRRERELEARR